MTTFLTGATGYIGSYIAHLLLEQHNEPLALLVRAGSPEEGAKRLWKSLQLHMDFPTFQRHLAERIEIDLGPDPTTRTHASPSRARRASRASSAEVRRR